MHRSPRPLLLQRRATLRLLLAGLALPALAHASLPSPAELATIYRGAVDRRLEVPEAEARFYGRRAESALATAARLPQDGQYLLVVDRDPYVQAAFLMWRSAQGTYQLVGASPVTTGHPGPFDRFPTPLGVFELAAAGGDPPVLDFGLQPVSKEWGDGVAGRMRLLLRAPADPALERRLGVAQSDGAILLPATLVQMLHVLAPLPRAPASALVVIESGRSDRPAWSPAPYLPHRAQPAPPPAPPLPPPKPPAPPPAIR